MIAFNRFAAVRKCNQHKTQASVKKKKKTGRPDGNYGVAALS
jgi:hypothetical protein